LPIKSRIELVVHVARWSTLEINQNWSKTSILFICPCFTPIFCYYLISVCYLMDRWKFWLKAINQLDLTKRKPWTPSKFDVLCSDHFSAEEFTLLRHTKLKILKDMAVSSILSWKIQHQVVVLLILCYNSCNGMTFISSCSVSLIRF